MTLKQKQAAAPQFNLAKYLAGHHHPMAVDNISTLAVSLIACAAALAAFVWQLLRRKNKKSNQPQASVMRRNDAGHPLPNEHPAEGAVKKPKDVYDFDSVGVKRPTMLAVTTKQEEPSASELFIQRAFKIDRGFWREIEVSQNQMRGLDCLFAEANKLAWVPGSAFERHIYSVSFAPALEAALQEGIFRTDCSAGVVTHVSAIDETGEALGDPMKMSLAASKLGLVAALWSAFNPKGMPHELRAELDKENAEVAKRLSDLPQHVAYETVASWTMRYASLSAVVAAVKSGVTAEQVPEYLKEIDSISKDMHEQADRIDEAIEQRAANVFNLEDADDALIHAIAYMYVRDLTVRFMRICSLLRVSIGDSFEEEVRCANAVAGDVNQFTDVRSLIAAAQKVAHDKLDPSRMRTAGEHEISRATAISKHAQELTEIHDGFLADLQKEARKVQDDIDQALLRQARLHRYAVRVSDEGLVEKFFVLNA